MDNTDEKSSNLGKRRARRQVTTQFTKNEAYQERRDEILHTARELFMSKGYDNTSLGDISAALNTDRATLYYYVSSKKDVFDAVVDKMAEMNVIEIENIARLKKPAIEKLRESMILLNRSYKESYPLLQMHLNALVSSFGRDAKNAEQTKADWSTRYYQSLCDILQQGVDEGDFILTMPVGLTALGLIGMLNWSQAISLGSNKAESPGRLSPEEVGEGFANLVFSGIVQKRAKRRGTGRTPRKTSGG